MAVFFGALICFFGYPMIHSAIRVWGFIVGGAFALVIAMAVFKIPGSIDWLTPQMGIAFGVGGILGAIIAGPLSIVIIFLSGLALGFVVVTYGYPFVPFIKHNQDVTLWAIAAALGTGLLSIRFQEVVMIVTTALVGAAAFIYGANKLMRIDPILLALAFFLALFFGAASQYKSVHPESSLLKF
jgi:hypothetical protein